MKVKLLLIVGVLLVTTGLVSADGGFVHHYHEDVFEPNQKAVIFYDESQLLEKLILQVKYEGNVSDFGWVVPTPTVPELDEAPGDIFFELSQLTSEDWSGKRVWASGSISGKGGDVTVIKQEQVGIYNASVLDATDALALVTWLNLNGYVIHTGLEDAIQYYIGKGWCFTAIKIDIPAYIKGKIETYQEIDERITNLSNAEEYLVQDLMDDILSKKSYDESVASKLGIPEGDIYYRIYSNELLGYRWLYTQFWGCKNYGDLKGWMYSYVKDCIWGEITQVGVTDVLMKYEGYGFAAHDEYDLVDRICYQIYCDIKENLSYNDSIASIIQVNGFFLVNGMYKYLKEKYYGEPNFEVFIEGYIRRIIESLVRVGDTEDLLRYGEIQPIVFTFESGEPVYPLRITSINGYSTEVLIYLFAQDKQTTIHYNFSMEYSSLIKPGDVSDYIVLREFIKESLYLTKLRAIIPAEDMDRDVTFVVHEGSILSVTPGFQVVILLISMAIILFLFSRKNYPKNL